VSSDRDLRAPAVGRLCWNPVNDADHEGGPVAIQLSMVGLIVKDMPAALAIYRHLGLEIPSETDSQRLVMHRMDNRVTLFWDTYFAETYDPAIERPQGGYQVMLEFFLPSKAAVDAKYAELVGLGYNGRTEPVQTNGPMRRWSMTRTVT
jgi:catechol 2,3-dioxygenase-like lactoylglutathione lyase family enzyme